MSLYEDWIKQAYDKEGRAVKLVWDTFIPLEQKIYEHMLGNKSARVTGTPESLARQYDMSAESVCGFLDGFNDAADKPIDIKALEPDQELDLNAGLERLYKKMVEYKATHLYTLPQWNDIFTPQQQKDLYYEQKHSGTIVKEATPSRNDPCPCGSGKKYKRCCGVA